SFEHIAERYNLPKAQVLADTLNEATTQYLLNNKAPARRVGQIDNRGGHFYLALYWAQALAEQNEDQSFKAIFTPIAGALAKNEETINAELLAAQKKPQDLGGYYFPTNELVEKAMRPSPTFNKIIDSLNR